MTISKYAKLILLYILLLLPDIRLFAGEVLTVGIFPRRNSVITIKMFMPLMQYLEKESGYTIKLETAKNFPEFWKRVQKKRFDIVHYNQLHYILSHEASGYDVFAKNEEFNRSKIASAILVRKDSGIQSIADLKNKSIIFGGGKLALIANVGNRLILKNAGLGLQDYRASFARNPPNATLAVYYNRADAAGVGDTALDLSSIKRNINTQELTYIALGKKQPHIPWAFSAKVSNKKREKLSYILLNLSKFEEGRKVLKSAGLTNLIPSKNQDYDLTRKTYKIFLDGVEK